MSAGPSIAFFGSSLVSAYWNGAATCYRGIIRALAERGHRVTFYEPDAFADFVVVGSYVPEGVAVGEWVTQTARGATAFYDIDTPVTLAKLARGDYEYLTPELIPLYDAYLSFTGGPTLRRLERDFVGSWYRNGSELFFTQSGRDSAIFSYDPARRQVVSRTASPEFLKQSRPVDPDFDPQKHKDCYSEPAAGR